MIKTDRDALIARYLAQYAEILLHTLNKENPRCPGINYHKRLCRLIRMHHAQQGRWLTEEETLSIMLEACRKLAHRLLIEESVPNILRPEDIFIRLKGILPLLYL